MLGLQPKKVLEFMRKKLTIANWKQNTSQKEATSILMQLTDLQNNSSKSEIIIAAPYTHLHLLDEFNFKKASQDCSIYNGGAYTGEISAAMLADVGVKYAIIGHSERRQYFSENSQILKVKIKNCLQNNITPIYCVGETLEQRESNQTFKIIERQLKEVLFDFDISQDLILAYEPVWAIGTGKTASAEQANNVHIFIRQILATFLNKNFAEKVPILYGGSIKADNAQGLFSQSDIDGGLVGGASLIAVDFYKISQSFS